MTDLKTSFARLNLFKPNRSFEWTVRVIIMVLRICKYLSIVEGDL